MGRSTESGPSVPVGHHPRDVAVDQRTNTIYDTGSRPVSVIAGAG